MATEIGKSTIPKFPLRLMPSVRQTAQVFSEKEGISLNTFINVAVAEKLAYLQHEEWVRNRKPFTPELAAKGLALLDKNRGRPIEPGDELPKDYITVREEQAVLVKRKRKG